MNANTVKSVIYISPTCVIGISVAGYLHVSRGYTPTSGNSYQEARMPNNYVHVWISPLGNKYKLNSDHPLAVLKVDGRTSDGKKRKAIEAALESMDEALWKSGYDVTRCLL